MIVKIGLNMLLDRSNHERATLRIRSGITAKSASGRTEPRPGRFTQKRSYSFPTPPPQGVAYCRRPLSSPSVRLSSFRGAPSLQPLFAVIDCSCFLELGVRRLCLLSRASAAVSSPFTFVSSFSRRIPSVSSPFTFARRSPFAFTRRSPFEFAFAFVWKPRCSATNPRAPPSRRTALFCRRLFSVKLRLDRLD
ncbi:hypothetical protein Ahy_B06g085590 isoform A [Arachis hypogaea]|uniref:Uncharacterized protein n=1 Tax=Arachis hypogaea TaxID=3818 RepID=A0A444YV21_ARAHY|nr:hypothetical protein Ahy_B06g085590 isoform A [Arachis hypogaea]